MRFGDRKSEAHPEFRIRGGFFSSIPQEITVFFPARRRGRVKRCDGESIRVTVSGVR
jgi:hypothetical protein